MEVKTLLFHWDGDSFLFDVKIIDKKKNRNKVMAEGRALVRAEKVNGKYCGHCCIFGEDAYTTEYFKKKVVVCCIRRAKLLKEGVIEANGETPKKQLEILRSTAHISQL